MRLSYITIRTDRRTGKVYRYVRNPSTGKMIAIKAAPDDPEFMPAYEKALAALGLVLLPNSRPERRRVMHRQRGNHWEHWQLMRSEPGSRWHRTARTKCVDDVSKSATFDKSRGLSGRKDSRKNAPIDRI